MKHNIENESCMADGEGAYVHCPTCDEDYQGEHICIDVGEESTIGQIPANG